MECVGLYFPLTPALSLQGRGSRKIPSPSQGEG